MSPSFEENVSLSWQAVNLSAIVEGGKKKQKNNNNSPGPKISGNMTKTFSNQSPAVQHQTALLSAISVQSQWIPSIFPPSILTHRGYRNTLYVHAMNAEREEEEGTVILKPLPPLWISCTYRGDERSESRSREVYLCVCMLSWWGEGQRVTGDTVYSLKSLPQWHLFSVISVFCLLLSRRPASASGKASI